MAEPQELNVGDTWAWTRELSDYPASVWTLTYHFRNATSKFDITATADGDTHSVSVTPATTAAYDVGSYSWDAYVTDGTDRHRVDYGTFEALPNLALDVINDTRSHWRIVRDNVEAVIQNRATKDQLSYSISGRTLQRMPIEDLLALHSRAQSEVVREDNAEAARNGKGRKSKIKVTFV